MNLSKPIQLITVGSLLTTLGIMGLLIMLHFGNLIEIGIGGYFLVGLFSLIISGGTFYFLIKNYINQRIRLIYKIIGNRKSEANKADDASLDEDIIGDITEQTREWAKEKTAQINVLQKDAVFRKEFIGNLAHELKTPVFSIQGYLLTLLEGGLEDENVNRQFCERALKGVDRISALLEDLDTISQFEIKQIKIKKADFDIVELTKELFDLMNNKAGLKDINLGFNKPYEPITVNADRDKIAQVLTNLISNSISYGNENGNTTVRFHNLESGQVLIEVADDGVGMEEKHLSRLFERFYRVDKSRERNVGGSGLGLAIAKHIIEAHGESINVRSTPDVGSTFSFTLKKV